MQSAVITLKMTISNTLFELEIFFGGPFYMLDFLHKRYFKIRKMCYLFSYGAYCTVLLFHIQVTSFLRT